MNLHARILNYLVFRHNYKTYLEIGLNDPLYNYVSIMAPEKEACDPYIDEEITPIISKYLTYHMTSDKMFEKMPADKKYDLIFVDGLHEGNQVVRDVVNSLKHLNPNGLIVIHDCLPTQEYHAEYPYNKENPKRQYPQAFDETWNGTTWQALPVLDKLGIKYEVVDYEFGLGIVRYQEGDFAPIEVEDIAWNDVFADKDKRDKTLHVIDHETFLNTY